MAKPYSYDIWLMDGDVWVENYVPGTAIRCRAPMGKVIEAIEDVHGSLTDELVAVLKERPAGEGHTAEFKAAWEQRVIALLKRVGGTNEDPSHQ